MGRFGVLLVGFGWILGWNLVKIRCEFDDYLMKLCIKWGLDVLDFGRCKVGIDS